MKIALVHDHLVQNGGAENVLRVFQEIFPQAPIYTLLYDKKRADKFFLDKNISTSFIQKIPGGVRKYQWFLPVMPLATESYDLSSYEVVLSSSSGLAKGVITQPETLHICYCHTPTRYLWTDTHSYVRELNYNWLIKKIIPWSLVKIRSWDKIAADRVDKFIANSKTVKKRIHKYYRCQSDVIYPPVETAQFRISSERGNYYLMGGRLVAYKRFDLVISAFNKLGIPLKIFGTGPEEKNLRALARLNVEILGPVSDKERRELYSRCLAFLHPQVEDFGITAIEAMASGRPVIAYRAGGALETIISGVTGEFFFPQEWESLADAVIRFKPENFDPIKIREHALNFDTKHFKIKIKDYIEESWREFHINY